MAKKEKVKENKVQPNLAKELCDQYSRDHSSIETIRNTWDEKEAMLLGVPLDSQTKSSKSKVFDPRLSTIIYERAARVCAQNPTGDVQALTKKDTGKNMLMDLVIKNYVVPNAKSQYDLLTKNRLWDVYSNVYGSYGSLVDYVVRDDYVGPDHFLIPIRNIVPQTGKANDLDYVYVRSVVSKKWLLSRDTKNWKNIDKLLERSKRATNDTDYESYVETKFSTNDFVNAEKDDFEQIEIITRYEPDRWVTFSRDAKLILRDMENPQKNGKIPVVFKHCFPLIDRFFGLGEFERGKTLQYAINSLINLYLDGVKMSIFPPLKVYLPDVVAKTMQYEPAIKWILKQNNPNAITQMQFSPQGIQTFQQTYQFLIGALLNQAGTTDTTIPAGADFSQGKTPQALKQLAQRENSRDSWDRFMLEKALEETFDRFVDLIAHRQEKPIKMNLFADEIKMIQEHNPDLAEMYESGKYGEVTVKPSDIKDTKYKFFINAGSTMKKDDEDQNATLTSILGLTLKLPGAVEQAMQTGSVIMGNTKIDVAETLRQWINTSGVNQPDKIVSEVKPEDMESLQMQQEQEQMAQQEQLMQQQQMAQPGMPQDMAIGNPPMGQPGQQINFEDPRIQELLMQQGQGMPQGGDPVAEIMNELQGVTQGVA